jgi:hemin uptake protein HemP
MPPTDPLPLPVPTTVNNPLKQKRIVSAQLFGVHREVVILHNGREYRLRLTQSGKLILTA